MKAALVVAAVLALGAWGAPHAPAEAPAPAPPALGEENLQLEGRMIAVGRLLCLQSRQDLAVLRARVALPGATPEDLDRQFGWQAFFGPGQRWVGRRDLVPYVSSSGEIYTLFCVSYDLAPSLIRAAKLWGGEDCAILGVRPIDYDGRREFGLYVQKGDKVYLQTFRLPPAFLEKGQVTTRHAMVETLTEVLALTCRHLPGSQVVDVPKLPEGQAVPQYQLRARELLDSQGRKLGTIGERPLRLADPVEQQTIWQLLRQRQPALSQSAVDLRPDALLTFHQRGLPGEDPTKVIPYADFAEEILLNHSVRGKTAQELQQRARAQGKFIVGVRPLCWATSDFALFMYDSAKKVSFVQPFSLSDASPRDYYRVAVRLQAIVPEVVRAILPSPAAAEGREWGPVPLPRSRPRR